MDGEQIVVNSTQETQSLRKEVERLTAENLLLRQRTELEHLWREDRERQLAAFDQHKTRVETEINKRLVGLSVVGLVVVGFGWWSVSSRYVSQFKSVWTESLLRTIYGLSSPPRRYARPSPRRGK